MKQTQKEMRNKKEANMMTKDQMIDKMRKMNAKHTDNMDSRKNALKVLMSGIPVADKTFCIIAVEDLHIDSSYQRNIQKHVSILAREWDNTKCDPLKVNYREDGNFYVWDGQHRLAALKMMGVDYVPCVVVVGLSRAQEAALFGCQGDGIKKPNPYDIFKANVCSGESIDTAIKKMCDTYKLVVSRSHNPGSFSYLTNARDIFAAGNENFLEWALDTLHKAKWNEFPNTHCYRFVNALYEIRRDSDGDHDFIQEKIVDYLRETSPEELRYVAGAKYIRYCKDESKQVKLFLLDMVNGDEEYGIRLVESKGKYIA